MPQSCFRRGAAPQPPRLHSSSFPVPSPAARDAAMPRRRCCSRSFLWVGVASVLLVVVGVAHAEPVATEQHSVATTADPIAAIIAEASQRFSIPASWIRAVMQVESFGDVRALSPKGAMGLMQIMPEAWAALRSRYGLGADPFDAHDNILAGAAYLRELLDRYGSPGFLAAYNAGPARYEDHLATGRALPAETQAYVAALAPVIGGGAFDDATVVNAVVRSWSEAPLFVVPAESGPTKASMSSDPRSGPAIDRQSSAGLDGSGAAIAGPVHRHFSWKSAAMNLVALDRRLAGHGGAWRVGRWETKNSTNGRQDKSAAFGRAQMVG
jgi:Transglycosylase SLT domain